MPLMDDEVRKHVRAALAKSYGVDKIPALVAEFEPALIVEAFDRAGGVQTRAARSRGMSERHLRYKLREYQLSPGEDETSSEEEGDDPTE
jgi:DNA-binding NtrC family response regulator